MDALVRPSRHRFDVDACDRMAEVGILPLDAGVELIDGDILDLVPIGSERAGSTTSRGARCIATANRRATAGPRSRASAAGASRPRRCRMR